MPTPVDKEGLPTVPAHIQGNIIKMLTSILQMLNLSVSTVTICYDYTRALQKDGFTCGGMVLLKMAEFMKIQLLDEPFTAMTAMQLSVSEENVKRDVIKALQDKGSRCWVSVRMSVGACAMCDVRVLGGSTLHLYCTLHCSLFTIHILNRPHGRPTI